MKRKTFMSWLAATIDWWSVGSTHNAAVPELGYVSGQRPTWSLASVSIAGRRHEAGDQVKAVLDTSEKADISGP
jgi:hypothetical protein